MKVSADVVVKRKADRTVDKRKGGAVLRGDLHKLHYGVDANQATAPVVRSSSMSAIYCVSALRRQHMVSFDCPSAYLQGQQQPSEQVLARPPPGFRTFDERGVAILWLMQNPRSTASSTPAPSGTVPSTSS